MLGSKAVKTGKVEVAWLAGNVYHLIHGNFTLNISLSQVDNSKWHEGF